MKSLYLFFAILISYAPAYGLQIPESFVQLTVLETESEQAQGLRNLAFCGAVKIAPRKYLTASHCTYAVVPKSGRPRVGVSIRVDDVPNRILSIKFPSKTLEYAREHLTCQHRTCSLPDRNDWKDVALIEFEDDDIRPAAAIHSKLSQVAMNQALIVSGSELVLGAMYLKSSALAKVVELGDISAVAMFDSGQAAVLNQGDSGSPVWVRLPNGKLELIGIASQARLPVHMRFIFLSDKLLGELN